MSNDHWAERNRKRRARKRTREAAERRHQELKEAWRRRRMEGEREERRDGPLSFLLLTANVCVQSSEGSIT